MVRVIQRDSLQRLMDEEGEFLLLDVRMEEELVHGMLPGAKHLPLQEFDDAFLLPEEAFLTGYGFAKPKKNTLIVCYCRTGGRSRMAVAFLEGEGYTNAWNYEGSVQEWSGMDPAVRMY